MAYYQSVVQSGGRRAGKALSTHDQWKFLYDKSSSASTLFEPKAENLLHLVDTLNQTRLKGSTLSSDQMNQVNDIFSMMNGNRPSSNMFAPTGFGKTAIVELTMALTNKIAAKAPQFYYVLEHSQHCGKCEVSSLWRFGHQRGKRGLQNEH